MTDIGKILDEWDGMRSEYHPDDEPPKPAIKEHPRNWPNEARLDLHGMTAVEAKDALESFFSDAVRKARRKVLIVHGKGHHSTGEPVLKRIVLDFLDGNPRAGMRGYADRRNGGRGATWVVIK
jgi:DNA-nicking Smr family endonuclease